MQEAASNRISNPDLPPIPGKRYFTIGEVSELCAVKPHVLRYWEQEFPQLKPAKRRGNRRYYQHHDVLMVRRIRSLLYDQGFTIGGARQQLSKSAPAIEVESEPAATVSASASPVVTSKNVDIVRALKDELEDILEMLTD